MTSRHHYSLPGASFLKPRGSFKTPKTAATSNNVPSSSRDTRHASSSRAGYTQEAVGTNNPVRPPSASGYRTQYPNASMNGFHAPGVARPPSAQRPTTTPQASSSQTRLDQPDRRNVFSKMFSRKQTPVPGQTEEKQRSSSKSHRGSKAYPGATAPIQAPHPGGMSTSQTAYDASFQIRDSDRDDQNRVKAKDDRARGERTKEERERLRAEYKAKLEEAERAQSAAAKTSRMDRTASRPSREERRQQEYDSDNARRRPQAQQIPQPSQKQEARQSQYLHPAQVPTTAATSRTTAPVRDGQQTVPALAAVRPPGVPVQASTSSQSTSASHQAQASRSIPLASRMEPSAIRTPVPIPDSTPAPPPKTTFNPYQISSHPLSQNTSNQVQVVAAAPNMLPPYQPPTLDDRQRLDREAAEREALLSQERERAERERELTRRREAEREAAEKEVALAQERERQRELEKRRQAEQDAADRDLQQRRERDRERELDRERRRARRAERERQKEAEKVERERRKELENAERERQKQSERAERERFREQLELEKQKGAERLRRERKERECAEKERIKAEREQQLELEQAERARQREKAERERDRAARLAVKYRSHRDKSQSMPTNTLLAAAASGSDTDRMTSRKEGRHRSHSHPAVHEFQPHVVLPNSYRPEPRKDTVHAPALAAAQNSVAKKDDQQMGRSQRDTPQLFNQSPAAPPVPPPRVDISQPRSASTVPISTPQTQEITPPHITERSRTDPLLPTQLRAGGMQASIEPAIWNQPFSEAQAKLVSIHASQGPPDRSAYRAIQKSDISQPAVEQESPFPSPTLPISSVAHAGRPRSSLDQPSHRTSSTQPNATPPQVVPLTPQEQPQHDHGPVVHEPPAQRLVSSHSRHPDVFISTSITPTPRPPQPDMGLSASHGPIPLSSNANPPPSSVQTLQAQTRDNVSASAKPGAGISYGTGFSSYSQTVLGLTKELPRAPSHDQQVASMSRAPSNNSTRSPPRKTMQLLAEKLGGGLASMPVSRTASDASRSSEQGERRRTSVPYAQPQLASSQSQPNSTQSVSATPMYSSTQNASLMSRARYEPVTNLHHQSVPPPHFHSQSGPRQSSPSYPHDSGRDEVNLPRYDNVPNARAAAPIPGTIDALHQQYPSFQAPSSQSKPAYNSSTNAHLSVQSQQSHAVPSSTTQDYKPPFQSPMSTNNVSSYPAAVAISNTLSQVPSTMLSNQQPTHLPDVSMYYNPSTSRNHVSTHQTQHHQQATSLSRPPFAQHNSGQGANATTKSSLPSRAANPSVYVTSTRQSGPFAEESPSSVGGGLSLDSPSLINPSFLQPIHSPEQFPPRSGNIRPPSQLGPQSSAANGSHQTQPLAETQKSGRPQDSDSPPPLTPTTSSHESHDEILMTPASLDQARTQVDVKQPPDSSERLEKKKGGLFRVFRSNSTKALKDKNAKDKDTKAKIEPRELEPRRQVPGSRYDQRSESVNRPRSTRPPSIMAAVESDLNPTNGPISTPTNTGTMTLNQQSRQQSRASKHVPPPISIPPPSSIPYRLFTSKSKRYRTMSSASMEAIDGTANNTVVGSPTSSRRSPTPSGPMTPPIRDPIEAAQAWRNNEDVFLDPGSQRRRRPGVTFDLQDVDGQKDSTQYRRSRNSYRPRRDSSR